MSAQFKMLIVNDGDQHQHAHQKKLMDSRHQHHTEFEQKRDHNDMVPCPSSKGEEVT